MNYDDLALKLTTAENEKLLEIGVSSHSNPKHWEATLVSISRNSGRAGRNYVPTTLQLALKDQLGIDFDTSGRIVMEDVGPIQDEKTTFEKYQELTAQTAIYPKEAGQIYTTLGLVNEAGEVAGKVKKILRDDCGVVSGEKRAEIAKELGDVLWYLSQCATEFCICLESIAIDNLAKLQSRKERGVLGGSGDNR